MNIERGINLFQMGIHRVGFDTELVRDFRIRQSPRGKARDLLLARRQCAPVRCANHERGVER